MKREELSDTLPRADRAGVFSLPADDIAVIAEVAATLDFAVFRADLTGCAEPAELFVRLQEQLKLPAWFGQNWDALADCLTDLSWREAPGYLLVLENMADFRSRGDDDFDTLIQTLSDASANWSGLGTPFWAFLVLEQ
ncbi:MAG: barstar family protein [Gammaproteobacteria bacterium]